MLPKYILYLFIIIAFCSCGEKSDKDKIQLDDEYDSQMMEASSSKNVSDSLSLENLTRLSGYLYDSFSKGPDDIKVMFGKPKNVKTDTVTNIHTNETDEIMLVDFDEFSFELYHYINGDKYLLQQLELRSDFEKGNISLKLNSTTEEIVSSFGAPTNMIKEDNNSLIYEYIFGEVDEQINFHFNNNRLVKVKYLPYID